MLKKISTYNCAIGNNCISSIEPHISYTVQLEEEKDKNKVQCSFGTSIRVICIDGVARRVEARTGFCQLDLGAGGPVIKETYRGFGE